LVTSLSLLEFALRFYRLGDDERNLLYEHHELFGWFPQNDINRTFKGAKTIQVNHNSYGFRGSEFNLNTKKKKILILGDSFAYGYDSEEGEIFSQILGNELEDYEIFNLGVSGYSTDQELLLLKEYFHLIKPDLVYLLYCHNDWYGNSVNQIYNGYYKPYYIEESETDSIKLQGVPVPKSILHLKYEHPILYKSKIVIWLTSILYNENLAEITVNPKITFKLLNEFKNYLKQNQDTQFKIGIVGYGDTPGLTDFLKNENFDWIVIDNNFDAKFFTKSGHWSALGKKNAAKKMSTHIQL